MAQALADGKEGFFFLSFTFACMQIGSMLNTTQFAGAFDGRRVSEENCASAQLKAHTNAQTIEPTCLWARGRIALALN